MSTELQENPLISYARAQPEGEDGSLTSWLIPFDAILPAHVVPAVDALLGEAREALGAIGEESAPPTYRNTLHALEEATEPLERAMGVVGHLESVATSEALRAAYNVVRPRVSELYSSIALDPKLYDRLVAFSKTEEASGLDPVRRRFLDKELRAFRRNGAELDEAGKERLRTLDVELTKLTTKYAQNLLDETNAFELIITDPEKLAGLPESARDAARASASSKGLEGWRFTLQAPSLIAVLTHLEDASIREHVWRAYNRRASEGERDNRPLIARIVELRGEKAELLGFANFADFVLEERMAKGGVEAQRFVRELTERTRPFFEQEVAELDAFRRAQLGDGARALQPWDISFWAERLRREKLDFDEERLRSFFPVERVLDGLFAVANRLYGVTVEPEPELPVWHDDVRVYRLLDGGELRGTFYVDLFPREKKRGGAWMNSFIVGGPGDDAPRIPHVGLFCGNVTPPLGDQPALLRHSEVETLFHEFGHLMHLLLSDVPVRSLAATNVAWDFVELPSQIMENWTWEREALDLFARHHESGAPIDDALYDRLLATRTFRAGSAMMRQLGFAHVDLALHIDYRAETGDPVTYARGQMDAFAAASLPEDYAMICGFSHLFASPVGYAAGYYSYKWAEVLEADAFSRFAESASGVFDPEVGAAFRAAILSRGDADAPDTLFRDFMGRDPDVSALLARSGLAESPTAAPAE